MAIEVPWPPVDGDPWLYTTMMQEMGAAGVQVEELYTLDMPEFEAVAPIFGLIFLYKWRPDELRDGLPLPDPAPINPYPEQLHSIFFANQVINAAAVTQALVTILMNVQVAEVTLGPKLTEFKSYCTHLDPGLSGLAIHNAAFIRDSHLKVSRPPPSPAADGLGPPPPRPGEVDEDVYHFITWIPVRPPGTAWLGPAAARLRAYVEVYAVAEVRHSVLGVVAHRVAALLADLEALRGRVEAEGTPREGDEEREADILHRLAVEDDRATGWAAESARRRHDYMPFLVETLKLLASKGELTALIDAAREQKRAAAKAAAKAAKAARGSKSKAPKGGGGAGGEGAAGGSRG